jgi:2,3-dihydroxybenzoate-AMP ligase
MSGPLPGWVPWPAALAERYRARGVWTGQTLGELLAARASRFGPREALVAGDRRLSYAELDLRVHRLAAGFRRLGLRPRDRVVLQLHNGVSFVESLFALARVGAAPVLAHPAHRAAEILSFASQTEAVAYLLPDAGGGFDYPGLARQIVERSPELRHVIVDGSTSHYTPLGELYDEPADTAGPGAAEVALFQLSGGSTGTPKLIPRTHDDYLYSVRRSAEVCGFDPATVYLCSLPAGHNFPLSSPGVLGTLWAGGRVVMAGHPAPDHAFSLIARESVTVTALVPALALVWAQVAGREPGALRSLRLLQVGGARLSADQARAIRTAFGCQLQQVYGMAEGLVCYTRPEDPDEVVLGSQGRPMSAEDELKLVDDDDREVAPGCVGHLLTRGPYTVRGYYRAEGHNATAFTADGFYRTGDLVRMTGGGNLVVVGRSKDQINRGGEKIAAAEVEDHLLAHPNVAEAALVPVPDPFLGERSCAYVVAGQRAFGRAELADFLRERGLAPYKIPDRWVVVASLPRTSVGKIDKIELRRRLGGGDLQPAIGGACQDEHRPDKSV